jgi:hypothetical protein
MKITLLLINFVLLTFILEISTHETKFKKNARLCQYDDSSKVYNPIYTDSPDTINVTLKQYETLEPGLTAIPFYEHHPSSSEDNNNIDIKTQQDELNFSSPFK